MAHSYIKQIWWIIKYKAEYFFKKKSSRTNKKAR